jgi:hypothetical protein
MPYHGNIQTLPSCYIVGNKKERVISIHMSMPIINEHMERKIIYTKVYKLTGISSIEVN